MWVPKWYWEYASKKQDELERRVKRLERILLREAENRIASFADKEAGAAYKNGYASIEEVANQIIFNRRIGGEQDGRNSTESFRCPDDR